MKNILLILVKYGTHLLFIVFQIICFALIVSNNEVHRGIYDNTQKVFFGNFNNKIDQLSDYLTLDQQNDSLVRENARLMDIIINQRATAQLDTFADTAYTKQYDFIPAEICNKTINLRNNYFTICAGSMDGVKPTMGVINAKGIVGITTKVSEHYSEIIPLLHSQSRTSASIKGSDFFGNLLWVGSDPSIMRLEAIPKHAPIAAGDTIITSGYSSIYPKGLLIGTVSTFQVDKGSSNYSIDVKLFNDLFSTSYVFVVKNNLRQEQISVETSINE